MKALGGFFSRYAKAMVPVILAAAGVVQRCVETGHFDRVSAGAVAYGAIAALAVSLVANAQG
jgi:hypothetical protein